MIKYYKRIYWNAASVLLFWIFVLSVSGNLCKVDLNLNQSCKNCSNTDEQLIKAYHQTDQTPFIRGCFGSRALARNFSLNNKFYEETHFIYIKKDLNKEVLLDIQNALSDSMRSYFGTKFKSKISIVLISPTLLNWKVSLEENDTDFVFYATSKSTVTSSSSVLTVIPLTFHVTTSSGRLYHALQMKEKFCKSYDCHLTSFLQLENVVDTMRLTVGAFNESGGARKCSLGFNLKKIQPTNKISAFSFTELPTSESCAGKNLSSTPYFFVLDFVNSTGVETVDLELVGISSIPFNRKVFVVLHSTVPLKWTVLHDSSRDVSTSVTFVVPLNSSVNAGDLVFSNESGGVRVQHIPGMVPEGTSLLDEVRSIYNVSVTSYARFVGLPNRVKIFLKDENLDHTPSVPASSDKLNGDLVTLLHAGFKVTSEGAFLNIPWHVLENYEFKISDVIVGDGSCNLTEDIGRFSFSDLSHCGLERISIDDFRIQVSIKGVSIYVRFMFPPRKARLRLFSDAAYSDSTSSPVQLEGKNTFYADISATAEAKFGVNTLIRKCFLTNWNASIKHVLNFSCPFTSKVNSTETKPAVSTLLCFSSATWSSRDNSIRFAFNVTGQLGLVSGQLYNMTCVLSRCFVPVPHPVATLLDRCPRKSCQLTSVPYKQDIFNQTVSVKAFVYQPAPATIQGDHPVGLLFGIASTIVVALFVVVVAVIVIRRSQAPSDGSTSKAKYIYSRAEANGDVSDRRVDALRVVGDVRLYCGASDRRCVSESEKLDPPTAGKLNVTSGLHSCAHRSDSSSLPTYGSKSTEEFSLLTSSTGSSDRESSEKSEKSTSSI